MRKRAMSLLLAGVLGSTIILPTNVFADTVIKDEVNLFSNDMTGGGVGGINVTVSVTSNAVHIKNDSTLKTYLNNYGTSGAIDVAKYAKTVFRARYRRELKITDNSLAIEILGHVYPSKLSAILPISISEHLAVIDCGEYGHDGNRIVWDTLAGNYSMNYIDSLLKKIKSKKLGCHIKSKYYNILG